MDRHTDHLRANERKAEHWKHVRKMVSFSNDLQYIDQERENVMHDILLWASTFSHSQNVYPYSLRDYSVQNILP